MTGSVGLMHSCPTPIAGILAPLGSVKRAMGLLNSCTFFRKWLSDCLNIVSVAAESAIEEGCCGGIGGGVVHCNLFMLPLLFNTVHDAMSTTPAPQVDCNGGNAARKSLRWRPLSPFGPAKIPSTEPGPVAWRSFDLEG